MTTAAITTGHERVKNIAQAHSGYNKQRTRVLAKAGHWLLRSKKTLAAHQTPGCDNSTHKPLNAPS
jgi:hypothetical protein